MTGPDTVWTSPFLMAMDWARAGPEGTEEERARRTNGRMTEEAREGARPPTRDTPAQK
jgi:hypothetical protein